jgi:magnesium chelatase accessory protein
MTSLNWARDGADWPNRESSQFVAAAGLSWHVQRAGSGPVLLLLHGTGASTHSWRDLLPLLARTFTVVAPDLPGHGFTSALPPDRQSLPGMAEAIAGLLTQLSIAPQVVVGHSAGAALLVRLCLDGRIDPQRIISLNGAFLPYGGPAFQLLKPLTRLLAGSDYMAALLSRRGGQLASIRRVIERTGSTLDPRGLELYARLVSDPSHVAGALAMMAGWDLRTLLRDLPKLRQPLALLVGMSDSTISPAEADRVQSLVPNARIVRLWGLGHLAHEERPEQVAHVIGGLVNEPLATA